MEQVASLLRTQIELRDPKSLKPYKRNNKKHPPAQIKKLMRSIAETGFDQPIVVDKHGVVIKGHGRLQASLEMQLKQVPVIVAFDLTPEQVRLARLADNTIADDAPFDLESVKFELSELADLGVNLDLTGFDQFELDAFLEGLPTTDFQASQVIGEKPDNSSFRGQYEIDSEPEPEAGEQEEPEEKQSASASDERFPLAIVLSWAEMQQWKALKEERKIFSDKKLLLEISGIS